MTRRSVPRIPRLPEVLSAESSSFRAGAHRAVLSSPPSGLSARAASVLVTRCSVPRVLCLVTPPALPEVLVAPPPPPRLPSRVLGA